MSPHLYPERCRGHQECSRNALRRGRNHYLIQKADAADDYALSSAATVGDLTDGAIVSTQGRKVTETNAAGTATDVYVDNDTYTVTEEGNWYKVGGRLRGFLCHL